MNTRLADFIQTLPEELRNIPEVFYAPYGFKLVKIQGVNRWCPGTFEDYQEAEAARLGVDRSEIAPKGRNVCYNSSPTKCAGACPTQYGECGGEIHQNHLYCHCII